jgi:hypothetical protein
MWQCNIYAKGSGIVPGCHCECSPTNSIGSRETRAYRVKRFGAANLPFAKADQDKRHPLLTLASWPTQKRALHCNEVESIQAEACTTITCGGATWGLGRESNAATGRKLCLLGNPR